MEKMANEKKLEILKFLYGERKGTVLFYYYVMKWGTTQINNRFGWSSSRSVVSEFEEEQLERRGSEMVRKEFDRVFEGGERPEIERYVEDNKLQQVLYDNAIFTKRDFVDMEEKELEYLHGIGKALLPKIRKEYLKLNNK